MYTLLWNRLIGNNCRHLASEKLVSLSCHCVHSTCEDLRGTFSSKLFATGALSPLPPEIEPFHGYFWGLSTAPRVCKDSSEVDLSNSRSKLSGFHPSGRAQGGALVSALWHKGPFAWYFISYSSEFFWTQKQNSVTIKNIMQYGFLLVVASPPSWPLTKRGRQVDGSFILCSRPLYLYLFPGLEATLQTWVILKRQMPTKRCYHTENLQRYG